MVILVKAADFMNSKYGIFIFFGFNIGIMIYLLSIFASKPTMPMYIVGIVFIIIASGLKLLDKNVQHVVPTEFLGHLSVLLIIGIYVYTFNTVQPVSNFIQHNLNYSTKMYNKLPDLEPEPNKNTEFEMLLTDISNDKNDLITTMNSFSKNNNVLKNLMYELYNQIVPNNNMEVNDLLNNGFFNNYYIANDDRIQELITKLTVQSHEDNEQTTRWLLWIAILFNGLYLALSLQKFKLENKYVSADELKTASGDELDLDKLNNMVSDENKDIHKDLSPEIAKKIDARFLADAAAEEKRRASDNQYLKNWFKTYPIMIALFLVYISPLLLLSFIGIGSFGASIPFGIIGAITFVLTIVKAKGLMEKHTLGNYFTTSNQQNIILLDTIIMGLLTFPVPYKMLCSCGQTSQLNIARFDYNGFSYYIVNFANPYDCNSNSSLSQIDLYRTWAQGWIGIDMFGMIFSFIYKTQDNINKIYNVAGNTLTMK